MKPVTNLVLSFCFVTRLVTQTNLNKNQKNIKMKVLSRYDLNQLNIRLPRKKYRILASQDNIILTSLSNCEMSSRSSLCVLVIMLVRSAVDAKVKAKKKYIVVN